MPIASTAFLMASAACVAPSTDTSLNIYNKPVSKVGGSYVVGKLTPPANGEFTITNDFLYAYRQLDDISRLEENWNGHGAQPFNDNLVALMKAILFQVKVYPEIFPLSSGEIQLEYYRDDNAYLQVKVSLNNQWNCFMAEGADYQSSAISADVETLNSLVNAFYERKF